MRAAFCPAPGRMELRDVPTARAGSGEVVVRVRSCGICGSDLHWFHGGFPAPAVCPGHEICGQIASLGEGVEGLRVGDRVVVEPLVVCRECSYCRTGNYQLCPRFQVLGLMRPGGFADCVAVPAYAVYPAPAGLDDALAALCEPTAVCVHGVRLAGIGIGDRVLVLGAGTIGLLSLLAARAAGAAEVAVTARHTTQADMARRLGATHVFSTTREGSAERDAFAAALPIDAVIETVGGAADTLNEAIGAVRPGGTVAVLGVFTAPPSLAALALVSKEVRLIGSLTYGRAGPRTDFEVALQLLERRRDEAAQLITHRFALDEIQRGFEAASDKAGGAIKVSIAP